jgi:vacuolar-type H+-ATPase subunit H
LEDKGDEARKKYEDYLKKQEEEADRKLLSPILS